MQDIQYKNISTDTINLPILQEKNITLDVLRLDTIHPVISGNKWFKLKYYLEEAKLESKKTLLSFGGAWSNHILATAAAARLVGLNSIGLIRGETKKFESGTLQEARKLGMQLFFFDRENYRQKIIPTAIHQEEIYVIPEGGYGEKGAAGAASILSYSSKKDYTHIVCAAGTGTMAAGLLQAILPSQHLVAVSVLKNYTNLEKDILSIAKNKFHSISVVHDYHFGGYAKQKPELIDFMNDFYKETAIPTDFVYTGKLAFAIMDLVKKNYFLPGYKILMIHSGGLQGNRSLSKGTLIF
ncbi:MAG: pyridoxal-phosphate dependent enzyme [Chitinophagaceae bacterium]